MKANLGQLVDDHGDEASIDYSLDLLLVPCCDVGQEPHGFLQNKPIACCLSAVIKTKATEKYPRYYAFVRSLFFHLERMVAQFMVEA